MRSGVTASIVSRRWLAGIMLPLAWAVNLLAVNQEDAAAAVTCRVRDDARCREFVLRPADPAPAAPGT